MLYCLYILAAIIALHNYGALVGDKYADICCQLLKLRVFSCLFYVECLLMACRLPTCDWSELLRTSCEFSGAMVALWPMAGLLREPLPI